MLFIAIPNSKLTRTEKRFLQGLYHRQIRRMWYVASQVLKNKESTEGAVQQTFLKLVSKVSLLMSFDHIAKENKYVLIATRNNALNIALKNSKHDNLEQYYEFIADSYSLENEVINKLELNSILKITSEINHIYGDAFYLKYFLELEYVEVAETLGISVPLARQRVCRAIELIKEKKHGDYDG